jgi:hypothetical protein
MGSRVAVISGAARAGPERPLRTLGTSRGAGVGPLRARQRPHRWPEKDFDLNFFRVAVLQLHDLVKSLQANRLPGPLKHLVLALNNRLPNGALALPVALDAGFQWQIEKD